MANSTAPQHILRDFVRGLRTWQDLELTGVTVAFTEDGCVCKGKGLAVVMASAEDVAEGMQRMRTASETAFRRWASALLAASAVVDLADLETHAYGETLLNALWDASAGEPLTPETVAIVQSLATDSPGD
jgi:hypothetical protein